MELAVAAINTAAEAIHQALACRPAVIFNIEEAIDTRFRGSPTEHKNALAFLTGAYPQIMQNTFTHLRRYPETAQLLAQLFGAPGASIEVDLQSAPQGQSKDVCCEVNFSVHATDGRNQLLIVFLLRLGGHDLSAADDHHRLEHAIVDAIPDFSTQLFIGRLRKSGRLGQVQAAVRRAVGNNALVIDSSNIITCISIMDPIDRPFAADWVLSKGYLLTMTQAFETLCRFQAGRETLQRYDKITVNILSGGGYQATDVVAEARVTDTAGLFITFWLRMGVYLRSSVDASKLELALTQALPNLKAGHARERIDLSGVVPAAQEAVRLATGNAEQELELDVEAIVSLTDGDQRRSGLEWLIGAAARIRRGGLTRRGSFVLGGSLSSAATMTPMSPAADGFSSTATTPAAGGGAAAAASSFDGDGVTSETDDAASTVATATTTAGSGARPPPPPCSPFLTTIRSAFTSLCRWGVGKETLSRFRKIVCHVAPAEQSQPNDVAVRCRVDVGALHLFFVLRTTRSLADSPDALQCAQVISVTLPQLQRGRDIEQIVKSGRLEALQDSLRNILHHYRLLLDVDFFSVTSLPDALRESVIAWILARESGFSMSLRTAIHNLSQNSMASTVFPTYRRLELAFGTSDPRETALSDIMIARATATAGRSPGGQTIAAGTTHSATATHPLSVHGTQNASWELPVIRIELLIRGDERNLRADYDASRQIERAVTAGLPELSRAAIKDAMTTRFREVQMDVRRLLNDRRNKITLELGTADSEFFELTDADVQHATTYLTTEAAFPTTMRAAFFDMARHSGFTAAFAGFSRILIHVISREAPSPEEVEVAQQQGRVQAARDGTSVATLTTIQTPQGPVGVAPGDVVFEARFEAPTLHLTFCFRKNDSGQPRLTCESLKLERAIIAAAREHHA